MALELSCTRAEADQKQLMRCRETLGTNSEAISEISKILALAGNETRLKILFLLYEEGELCPCDFADILEMSVPAISQHIRKMKDVGLIVSRREGQTLYYSLVQNHNEILENVFIKIQNPGLWDALWVSFRGVAADQFVLDGSMQGILESVPLSG